MKSSSLVKAAITAMAVFASISASAELCSTQSRGIYFVSNLRDVNQSSSDAVRQCQSSAITSNTECSNNLACGWNAYNPYSSGTAVCYTDSHNIAFQAIGRADSVTSLVQTTLQQCQSSAVTSNTECNQHIGCGDYYQGMPYPSGRVICSTNSHSIWFDQEGEASQVASIANVTLNSCRSNSVTSNTECSNNLYCEDAGHSNPPPQPYPPNLGPDYVTCTTFSHNITFRQSGPRSQVNQVSNDVLNQCRSNTVTSNTECVNNLRCN